MPDITCISQHYTKKPMCMISYKMLFKTGKHLAVIEKQLLIVIHSFILRLALKLMSKYETGNNSR